MKLLAFVLCFWHTIVCVLWFVSMTAYWTTHVYGPTLIFDMEELDRVDFVDEEECPLSTSNIEDLIVQEVNKDNIKIKPGLSEETDTKMKDHIHKANRRQNINKLDEHGVAIIKEVLTKETAQQLRDYVETANKQMHQVFVLDSENRYRIMPTPFETPIVAHAMKEISEHTTLRNLIDGIMGERASLVAFSLITSTTGAIAQEWHQDTTISAITHPEKFVHEYTLTIPLQDTYADMGATQICPGTHKCGWVEYDLQALGKELGVNIVDTILTTNDNDENEESEDDDADESNQDSTTSEDDYGNVDDDIDDEEEDDDSETRVFKSINEFEYEYLPCRNIAATLQQGDALIYHTDLIHRGGAFTSEDAQDRIVLFVTLAESKQRQTSALWELVFGNFRSQKTLPLGKVHSLDWKMWGLTIDDFPNLVHLHPDLANTTSSQYDYYYYYLRSLFWGPMFGYGSTTDKKYQPWNAIDALFHIFTENEGVCYYLNNAFDMTQAQYWSSKLMLGSIGFTFLYAWIGVPLWIYCCMKYLSSIFPDLNKEVPTAYEK